MEYMYLYVLYDKTAEQSSPIFEAVNHGVAIRQYNQSVAKELYADINLLCLGKINRRTCDITLNDEYQVIYDGSVLPKEDKK